MKKIVLTAILLFSSACGVNVVQVRSENAASTGWYDENGQVVTTEHGHGDAIVKAVSKNGYESGELMPLMRLAEDVMAYCPTSHKEKRCYTDAEVGDLVTVSTLRGPVRTSVVESNYYKILLKRKLLPGDSGSPVTRRGCIVGVAQSVTDDGRTIVVRVKETPK
jgi:hypothetical protein